MVDCCANPACRAEFKLLTTGDLYALERRCADTEFFWLCSACFARYELQLDSHSTPTIIPRAIRQHTRPAAREATLRLISCAIRRIPWRKTVPSNEPDPEATPNEWGTLAS
jgi:hypothetical protein